MNTPHLNTAERYNYQTISLISNLSIVNEKLFPAQLMTHIKNTIYNCAGL